MKHLHWLWLYLATSASLLAQCPTIDNTTGFGTPSTVCPDEPVSFTNPQLGAARYEWDFCARDLEGELDATFLLKAPGTENVTQPAIVQEEDAFHVFMIGRNNSLLRLDFDINFNFTLLNDLGNPSDVIDLADPIRLIKQNGIWYGFALNTFSINRFNLIKFTFENGIQSPPTGTDIIGTNFTRRPRALALAIQGSNSYVFVADRDPGRIIQLNFGSSFSNNLFTTTRTINLATNDNVLGIDIIEDCNADWHIVCNSFNGNFYHISYGNSLENNPSVDNISSFFTSITQPSGISIYFDYGTYYGLVSAGGGDIYSIDLGYPLLAQIPVPYPLGNAGVLSSNRGGLALANVDGRWQGVTNNAASGETFLLDISQPCQVSNQTSSDQNPPPISYRTLGTKNTSLEVFDIDGNLTHQYTDNIEVNNDALVSDFTFTNPCGFTVDFNNTSLGSNANVDSWTWDFGDGSAPVGDESPSHTYTATGNYEVALTVLANNGCSNTMTRTVTVTDGNDLEARFGMPTGLCVNSVFSPNDLSNFGSSAPDEANGYYWDFGDGTFSPFPNPDKVYNSTDTYTITLTIQNEEGCTDVFSETVTVQEEIPVSFTIPSQICANTLLT
ncbi:MAG: PKD domain-containing protein, partial [Bacteroidota bacterium]